MPPSVPQTPPDAGDGGQQPPSSSSGGVGGGEDSIKVAVRFRPLNSNERKQLCVPPFGSDDDDLVLGRSWRVLPGAAGSVAQRDVQRVRGQSLFSFDEAYDETRSTPDVFDGVCRTVVDGAMGGIDGTIFAYGQTGSGKTFTMQGPDGAAGSRAEEEEGEVDGGGGGKDGIVQMAARRIFRHISSAPGREYLVRTSFVEVYNEVVRDLLRGKDDPSGGGKGAELTVREDPKRGGVHMGCREVIVTDFGSLMDTVSSGELNRIVASTDMNAKSSRSHAIFRITVESREARSSGGVAPVDVDDADEEVDKDDRAVLVSTLNLVDLAGSESVRSTGATGQRQKEGGKINQSLLTLSQVINSLSLPKSKRPKHINYRNSKLTRILQASLSGNARMAVLCCASPSAMYVEETRSTLKFASRAKMVQTKARKNEVLDDRALIRRLQRELAEARRALSAAEAREREVRAEESAAGAPAAAAAEGRAATAAAAQDASEEREKLGRLKAMILHGDGLFGVGHERRVSGRGTGGRPRFAKSVNPKMMHNMLFASAPVHKSMRDLGQLQRQSRRCSVGVVQVAHHIDSDVLFQVYEEDESDNEDEPVSTAGAEIVEVGSRTSASCNEGAGAEVGGKLLHGRKGSVASSETDILREALAAKSELIRSLQVQLHASESEIQSLEERIQFLEQSQCAACRSAGTTQPSYGDDTKELNEEATWRRFRIHTLVVILSSAFFFFFVEKLGGTAP